MTMTEDRYEVAPIDDEDIPPLTDEDLARYIDDEPFARNHQDGYRPRVIGGRPDATGVFQLLDLDDLADLPDPEWLVEGVVPAQSLTVVFGAPGSTKSFWSLDLACSVASGHKLHGSPVKQGKVIYAAGEGHRGLKLRIEAWRLAHPDADMEALHRNLRVLPRAVRILDPTEATILLNTALAFAGSEGLGLFILDTWARALTGGDENSAQDAGLAIDVCDTIKDRTGATPLIVHHTGADGSRERGSTALRGAADAQMLMTKDDSDVVTLKSIKIKDGSPFEDRRFMLSEYGRSAVLLPHTPAFGGGTVFNGGKPRDDYREGRFPWKDPF
jgi:hypothetical protein